MEQAATAQCSYLDSRGERCPGEARGVGGLCFWHDPEAPKTDPDLRARLEACVREGRSLEGFRLAHADLQGVRLTSGRRHEGVNLTHADVARADLRGAHLYHIDLRGSRLLKADLRGANLNFARLEDSDLLGADLRDARLENVVWGHHVLQEQQGHAAMRAGERERAIELFAEAEETYRALMLVATQIGNGDLSGSFFRRRLVMRRMQMPRWSWDWFLSKLVDLVSGYGERVDRVLGFSLVVILICAALYFLVGVEGPEGPIGLNPEHGLGRNFTNLLSCIYYSVVTFTTLGYGDITPSLHLRPLAAAEAFIGSFSIALFVVVFVRRMIR